MQVFHLRKKRSRAETSRAKNPSVRLGLITIKGSAKQLPLLVFSTYIILRFLHNLFFLIFLYGLGFGVSNKKEIKKLKKKVQLMSDEFELKFQLMEHIIGNIHDRIAYLYA